MKKLIMICMMVFGAIVNVNAQQWLYVCDNEKEGSSWYVSDQTMDTPEGILFMYKVVFVNSEAQKKFSRKCEVNRPVKEYYDISIWDSSKSTCESVKVTLLDPFGKIIISENGNGTKDKIIMNSYMHSVIDKIYELKLRNLHKAVDENISKQ